MIIYDSQKPCSILKLRGSVFPRAVLYALPATLIATVVKLLETQQVITFRIANAGTATSSVYSGFTFVLGFVLVFRASQSYNRYWVAATSVHLMQAEWLTACSTLVAFVKISKKRREEVMSFVHTFLRLFALMHALALEDVSEIDSFPLLDIKAFAREDLRVLSDEMHEGRRVELVFQWIQSHVIKGVDSGLMNAPAPLLTRVFQNLGNGLVNYYSAQQVVIWPFPFAYAQMNTVLVFIYSMLTPFVIASWTQAEWNCALFTLVSVGCMIGLDLISTELENPFGSDPNDLPVLEMQNVFIQDLVMLIDPRAWRVPRLMPSARKYSELVGGQADVHDPLKSHCSSDGLDTSKHGRWKLLTRGASADIPHLDDMDFEEVPSWGVTGSDSKEVNPPSRSSTKGSTRSRVSEHRAKFADELTEIKIADDDQMDVATEEALTAHHSTDMLSGKTSSSAHHAEAPRPRNSGFRQMVLNAVSEIKAEQRSVLEPKAQQTKHERSTCSPRSRSCPADKPGSFDDTAPSAGEGKALRRSPSLVIASKATGGLHLLEFSRSGTS